MRRIFYAGSVHDQDEKDAVMAVLDDPQGLRIGKNVGAMERQVAELFGKARASCATPVRRRCTSRSAARPAEGSEVVTSPLTFSTDIAPFVRAGLVPVFVDVESDTFQVDVSRDRRGDLAEDPGDPDAQLPATHRIGTPSGRSPTGTGSRWSKTRATRSVPPRGTPTGTAVRHQRDELRLSHIITSAGTGGMVFLDDEKLRDRGLLLRRWGRRSEVQLYGTRAGERTCGRTSTAIRYDTMFIFDELGWNFEPKEMGAAFGLQQLKKLDRNYERRNANFAPYSRSSRPRDAFIPPAPDRRARNRVACRTR